MRKIILITAQDLPKNGVWGRDLDLKHYRKYLGTNQGDIFYSAEQGLFADAFLALSESIKQGFNFYLYLPKLKIDPDHLRYLDYLDDISEFKNNFNNRLIKIVNNNYNSKPQNNFNTQIEFSLIDNNELYYGRRGSGKSTALGKKIEFLISQQIFPILFISPFVENRESIAEILELYKKYLIILPPDEALRLKPQAKHLIIDEAAALAPQQLISLCKNYNNFTLATTSEGYEGSANQFFIKTIHNLKINKIYNFNNNFRHQINDELEVKMQEIFLLNIKKQELKNLDYKIIEVENLITKEDLLKQIWSLLKLAHYKTKPSDLKILLDKPQKIFVALNVENQVLGVLQIFIENPLVDENLVLEIIKNQRRPQGRILMQNLLLRSQNPSFAREKIARIVRIAVNPLCRKMGIARALINYAKEKLNCKIAVLYTENYELEIFWKKLGFSSKYSSNFQRSRNLGKSILRVNNE